MEKSALLLTGMWRTEAELRADAAVAFDAFDTCGAAYFASPSTVRRVACDGDAPPLNVVPSGVRDHVGLSRWQYAYAFAAVIGVEPPISEVVAMFGANEVARTSCAVDLSCEDAAGGLGVAGRVTRAAFIDRVASVAPLYADSADLLWPTFDAFDEDQKGCVTENDFVAAVASVDRKMPVDSAHQLFRALKSQGSDRLLFADMERLLWAARSLPPVVRPSSTAAPRIRQ